MIASTSHDMRTPLNTIINMHTMIEPAIQDRKTLKYLKVAKTSTNILIYLVNDNLDYCQIKSQKFSIKNEQFKIQDIVNECSNIVKLQMKQKGLQRIIEIDPSL